MSRFRLLFIASLSALASACSQSESVECGTDVFCPPGFQCIAELSYCIDPLSTLCGNGVVDDGTNGTEDRGEKCDDGNFTNGDGCSWNCKRPFCGDRLVDTYDKDGVSFTEVCDDGVEAVSGQPANGDGCAATCTSLELCGDGEINPRDYKLQSEAYGQAVGTVLTGGEACDPAPGGVHLDETDTCNLDCTPARCGDGKVNAAAGETCDPGTGITAANPKLALAPTDGCNADCSVAVCGDGKTNPLHLPRLGSTVGEQCDIGKFCSDPLLTPCTSSNDCLALQTGGVTLGDVECKTRDLPCCTSECFNTACGDTITQSEFVFPAGLPQAARDACQAAWVPEQCDDGNLDNNDGCDTTCKTEECGDGQRSPHAFRRLRALFADGSPNTEGTAIEYDAEPSDPVTALEICDDGKHCSVNGKLCEDDNDCLDNQGGVIGDGRCLARSGDGCSADCLSIETCGSGDGFWNDYPIAVLQKGDDLLPVLDGNGQPIVIRQTPAEVCDDGNNTDGDGCAANCFSSGICGNGILDTGELCDYGRTFNGTGIVPDKTVEAFCLEGALPEPQACDFPCNRDCTLNVQGDGKLDPGEQCDDGKTCVDGTSCEEASDCAEVLSTDLDCKHREDDNCTFSGRLNLCGDGLPNNIGGWKGLDNLTVDARAGLEARYGVNGIPLQVCDSSGINTVACDRDCTFPECGDIVVCLNLADSSTCQPNTPLVNFTQGETCDNGPGAAGGETLESANCNTNCEIAFCGDGVTNVTRGEVCDDSNLDDGDGCAGNCRSAEVCGDSIANRYGITLRDTQGAITTIRPAEVCDEGPTGSSTCTTDCQSRVVCGDRYVNTTETCDDGNTNVNDGCSASCQTETGWNCPTTTVTVGSPPTPGFVTHTTSQRCVEVCGDGLVAGDETCDNGKQCTNGTACTADGQCAGIGDGTCQVRTGDGCSATCRVEVGWSCQVTPAGGGALHSVGGNCAAVCGDRLIRTGEECDDGNVDSGDGCNNSCDREPGYTCPCSAEPGFVCGSTGGIGGACGSVCGDGGVIGFEECDDGKHCLVSLGADGDEGTGDDVLRACSTNNDCLVTDANAECRTRSSDGCNAGCRAELGWECPTQGGVCLPECGDFVIRGVEDCDDGRQCLNNNNNQRTPCSTNADCAAVPGDGLCATRSGDGCTATCTFEAGYSCPAGLEVIGGDCVAVCGDGLVRGLETCDDGDTTSGDGCDSGCRTELGWTCPANVGVNGAGGNCAPTCADGLIRGNETCDEGVGGSAAQGVTGGCVSCVQQSGWVCPTALLTGGQCASRCGDNIRVTNARPGFTSNNEQCDVGVANSNSGDCTLTCRTATCTDGFHNFSGTHVETDVDCGGVCTALGVPQRCANNLSCSQNSDCQTNYCDPTGEVCAAPPLVGPTLYVLEGTTLEIDIVDALFGGNNAIDLTSFEIVGAGASACGGEVDYNELVDANSVFFDPEPAATASNGEEGCVVGTGSAYSDEFSYRVCAIGGAPCFTETATLIVNRKPVVADAARCLPTNTANATLDVANLYTDADGHAINPASITNTGAGGTHSKTGTSVTFTPTNAATAATYNVALNACDTAQTPGCDTATWALQWNDPPVVASRTGGNTINVFVTEAATPVPLYTAADRIITNNGTVTNTVASVTVGAFSNGPFGPTTTTARGSCTVNGNPLTDGTIAYTAGSTTGTDSCFVRVCETCSNSDLCSVAEIRYNLAPLPVANDDQVFALEAANPAATGATGSFTVASLQTNDTPAGLTNFAFVSATTACSGTVVNNAGTITYTGPSGLAGGAPCRTVDSFSYRVCSPVITARCDTATVNIEINQRPVLADTFTCSPINTPNRSLNVNDLFTDADGDALKSTSILATGASGTSNRVGSVVTWTPSNTATATTYTVNLTACDDGTVEGCDTAVWTARWNDPPVLRTFPDGTPIAVVRTEQSSLAISTGGTPILISTGAVTGVQAGEPIASTAVGAFSVGPFSQSVTTSLGGTCQITGGNVVYTAANVAGNDSCFVQICETCSGNNVCAVTRIPFKVISAPAPVNDSVQAAEESDARARGTFPISALVGNDLNINPTTFALKSGTGTPGCVGAVVTSNGTNVSYVGPAIAGCGTTDSFVYTVCSADIVTRCADATVTVDINRRPTVADGFTCMPQGSTRGSYTVGSPDFADSDNDGVGTVLATAPGNPGLATVAGAVVTWAPDNQATPRYYDISLNVCDNAPTPACATSNLRASWNDQPTLSSTFSVGCSTPEAGVLCVGTGQTVDLSLDNADTSRELITDFGVVVGVPAGAPTPIGSITFPVQGTSGTCSVFPAVGVPTAIRYTANGIATNPATPDSCTVRVCETCNGGSVCSDRVVQVRVFTASVAVADEFGVLSTDATNPTVTVPRSFFTDNDTNIAAGTFAIPLGATTCGGTVAVNGSNVEYTKPDDTELANCGYVDTFDYEVDRVGQGGEATATVTVRINRPPTLTFTDVNSFVCKAVGTANHELELLPDIYADPDDPTSALSALTGTEATTLGAVVGSTGDKSVTFTPTDPAVAQRFAVTVMATDNALNNAANNSRGTASGVWHSVWNDPPDFNTVAAIAVTSSTAAAPVTFAALVEDFGDVNGLPIGDGASPWATVRVSSTSTGTFGATADLGDGSSCGVTGVGAASSITFTAGATTGSKSCFVEVCEVCGTTPVCAVKELFYNQVGCLTDLDCTQDPANTCADNVVQTFPGVCNVTTNACEYDLEVGPTCDHGCFAGACNAQAPAFSDAATATEDGTAFAVTLDEVLNLGASNGLAPADVAVRVRIEVGPAGGLQSLTLNWSNNDFTTAANPVVMTKSGQNAGKDVYEAVIPAQDWMDTVRFYLQGHPWTGADIFDPGNNTNYTYVAEECTRTAHCTDRAGGVCGVDNLCAYPPTAPQTVVAVAVDDDVTVDWEAPVSTGGSAITSYTATLLLNGNPTASTCTSVAAVTECDITGVPNGTYTAIVKATNAIGDSPNSAPSASFVVPDP